MSRRSINGWRPSKSESTSVAKNALRWRLYHQLVLEILPYHSLETTVPPKAHYNNNLMVYPSSDANLLIFSLQYHSRYSLLQCYQGGEANSLELISSILRLASGVVPNQIPLCTFDSRSQNWMGELSFFPVRASTPSSVIKSVCSNCADRFPSIFGWQCAIV